MPITISGTASTGYFIWASGIGGSVGIGGGHGGGGGITGLGDPNKLSGGFVGDDGLELWGNELTYQTTGTVFTTFPDINFIDVGRIYAHPVNDFWENLSSVLAIKLDLTLPVSTGIWMSFFVECGNPTSSISFYTISSTLYDNGSEALVYNGGIYVPEFAGYSPGIATTTGNCQLGSVAGGEVNIYQNCDKNIIIAGNWDTFQSPNATSDIPSLLQTTYRGVGVGTYRGII